MKILLDSKKNFYKAALHTHSVYSDGKKTVEEMKEAYKKEGYSVVAYTDHEHLIDNSHLDDKDFLTITSCEVAIKEFPKESTLVNHQMRVCHLNFYALDQHNTVTPCYSSIYDHYVTDLNRDLIKYDGEYERVYSVDGINEMIRIAKEQGFITCYNHPTWSLENATHYLGYEGLFAVEIYNYGCVSGGRTDDEGVFDDLLRAGKNVYCTAADDCHNTVDYYKAGNDSFGGWVCINADKLEYSTIMNALINGDFYASTGPQIKSLAIDGDKVIVETSPCKHIAIVTKGRRTSRKIAEKDEILTSAELKVIPSDEYFRVICIDENGKKAYSQAYKI